MVSADFVLILRMVVDVRMLNLNRLKLLQALNRRGSLIAVSQALSFSPSTVSHQLKVLEVEVGAPLLERVGRGLKLTKEGETLVRHADSIFIEVERAEAAVAAVGAVATGDVRVAALQTASLALLPHTLRLLQSIDPHPRMLVSRIEPSRTLDALASREFDVVLGEEYPGLPVPNQVGITREPLLKDPLVLVVPSMFVGPLTLANASESMSWVMEPLASDARKWGIGACRSNGVEPDIQFESDDLLVQMRLVETGHAVALLPMLLLRSEKPKLKWAELPSAPTRNIFTACRTGTELDPAIRAVISALRGSLNCLQEFTGHLRAGR